MKFVYWIVKLSSKTHAWPSKCLNVQMDHIVYLLSTLVTQSVSGGAQYITVYDSWWPDSCMELILRIEYANLTKRHDGPNKCNVIINNKKQTAAAR